MQRRIRPSKLSENYLGTAFPKPRERVVDMSFLNGGLNLWDLSYRLKPTQSPDLLNVYWRNGCLKSRPGQYYAVQPDSDSGEVYSSYDHFWNGKAIAHIGNKIVAYDTSTSSRTVLYSSLESKKGAGFFVFDDVLYYLGGGKYLKITDTFQVSEVVPFIPTVAMNRPPNGNGGDSYQPENRIGDKKKVLFTSDGTSKDYRLPYTDISSVDEVKVLTYSGGSFNWVTRTDYTVNLSTGVVTFTTAPAQQDPETINNVSIVCSKVDSLAKDNILSCKCLTVYGGNTDLAVVVGNCDTQPNAYFWSGNTDISLDPTYFPMDYYNLAGADAENAITGFGKQQGMLVIFQERSIGKTTFNTETLNDNRNYLSLNYIPVNANIGCNVPESIQLIDNNLCFANTYGGVYVLADTSSANENNVRHISKNIDGNNSKGLISELKRYNYASSVDDNFRYWLVLDGHTYVWDYTIKGYTANEENLSWFYFENINARNWVSSSYTMYYISGDHALVGFDERRFNDFGTAIPRKYEFATQYFGTYEDLKDVMKLVIAVRSDTKSKFELDYKTDWEERRDRTPVSVEAPDIKLLPRDLEHGRNLAATVYAYATVRIPRCIHIHHLD